MSSGVVYLFVSPSGRAYAGWHECDHATLPRRGTGPLPDKKRYTGSGKLWRNVARKHGPNLCWIILQRFPDGTPRATTDAAEQRAIRLVRHLWADRCANIMSGGQGFTSAEAQALSKAAWADPEHGAKMKAIRQEWQSRPEVRAKISAASKAAWADPDKRDTMITALRRINSDPAYTAARDARMAALGADATVRAKARPALEAAWSDPATKAKMSASAKARARRHGSEAHSAMLAPGMARIWADPAFRDRREAGIRKYLKERWADPDKRERQAAAMRRSWQRKRAAKALAPFRRPPSIQRPGLSVWIHRSALSLGIGGPDPSKRLPAARKALSSPGSASGGILTHRKGDPQ